MVATAVPAQLAAQRGMASLQAEAGAVRKRALRVQALAVNFGLLSLNPQLIAA